MSRPPDEYFAEPGPAPDEPPAGYFDDRPPELDALIDAVAAAVDETVMSRRCPDDGTCHHECVDTCFRVQCCVPLSGVYPNDEWPEFEMAPLAVRQVFG
jgi:hypothetical protein